MLIEIKGKIFNPAKIITIRTKEDFELCEPDYPWWKFWKAITEFPLYKPTSQYAVVYLEGGYSISFDNADKYEIANLINCAIAAGTINIHKPSEASCA